MPRRKLTRKKPDAVLYARQHTINTVARAYFAQNRKYERPKLAEAIRQELGFSVSYAVLCAAWDRYRPKTPKKQTKREDEPVATYIVRVPYVITVAAEVRCKKSDAINKANELCPELIPLYTHQEHDENGFDRPNTIETAEKNVWFENYDQCEFFNDSKTKIERT